jgi:glycosyltransferase involved in cell wall biosynthesis
MDLNTNRAISALIITLNEEIHMRELLTDLQFVDEVIVVDSFSTDGTKSISSEFANVKFIENRFENYTAQRNFAISQAKNDWILFLDADKRCS